MKMVQSNLLSKIDFHVHSEYSAEEQCKGFSIQKICELAEKKGIEYILLTDHWKSSTDIGIFGKARQDIKICKKRFPKVNILLSAEIDIINSKGETAIDLELAREVLDIVSVSPHHYLEYYTGGSTRKLLPDILEDAREMVVNASKIEGVALILHPEMTDMLTTFDIEEGPIGRPISNEYYYDMLKIIKENNKAIECTSIQLKKAVIKHLLKGEGPAWWQKYVKPLIKNQDENWWQRKIMNDYSNFIKAVVDTEVKFVIGTDAHNERFPQWLGNGPWFGMAQEETITLLKKYGAKQENLYLPF